MMKKKKRKIGYWVFGIVSFLIVGATLYAYLRTVHFADTAGYYAGSNAR